MRPAWGTPEWGSSAIAVMYLGQRVEKASAEQLFEGPKRGIISYLFFPYSDILKKPRVV